MKIYALSDLFLLCAFILGWGLFSNVGFKFIFLMSSFYHFYFVSCLWQIPGGWHKSLLNFLKKCAMNNDSIVGVLPNRFLSPLFQNGMRLTPCLIMHQTNSM